MKKIAILIVTLVLSVTAAAQQYTECVYLKNGSVIKGVIEEQIPNESLKIRTADGSLFVYQMVEVDKITKEAVQAPAMASSQTAPVGNRPSWAPAGAKLKASHFNDLYLDGQKLTVDEARDLLGPEYYGTFRSAYRQIKTGRTFLTVGLVGLGFAAVSLVVAATSENEYDAADFSSLAVSCGVIADVGICLGCIFKGVGNGRRNWVINSYNEKYLGTGQYASLRLEPAVFRCQTGTMGDAGNWGVGAALRVRF